MSAGRVWAIVVVALIHALLGYAFVTGLATSVIERVKEDLNTFDVEEPPPPEEEPPPPPPDQPQSPPPVTAPPVQQRLASQNPIPAPPTPPNPAPFNPAPPAPAPAPATPPAPPPSPPRQEARPAQQRSGSISNDDYPNSALRAEAQGTTTARYTVGTDGRVTSCTVTGSSGNSALDSTTCSLIQRRFRFRPAVGSDGNPTTETRTQRVVWRLPND